MKLVDIHRIPNPQYAILTSYRSGRTPQQNAASLVDLRETLRRHHLHGVQVLGRWKGVLEPALLVYSIDLKLATEIGTQYHQDAIIYAGPETGGETYLIYKGGKWKRFRSAFADFQSMS